MVEAGFKMKLRLLFEEVIETGGDAANGLEILPPAVVSLDPWTSRTLNGVASRAMLASGSKYG